MPYIDYMSSSMDHHNDSIHKIYVRNIHLYIRNPKYPPYVLKKKMLMLPVETRIYSI